MELEQKVADFIAAQRLLSAGEKVLLAVSGGTDSTCLLHVMAALKAGGALPVEIHCAHVNHQLRGRHAQRDQDFVIEQCDKLHLPVVTRQINVREYAHSKKLSIETAARILRIENLLDIARQINCSCIATAHQKDDNAETIIQRLSRGTGFRGLCGIWPAKEFTAGVRFVRPLLCVKRSEIVQYLISRNLKWCEDKTNEDFAYRRNFIRHRLLPAIQKDCRGCPADELFELSKASRGFYRLVCIRADKIWPDAATIGDDIALDVGVLEEQSPEVKIEIVRRSLVHLAVGEQDFTQQHYENIFRLSDGVKLQLPDDIEVHRRGGKIIFSRQQLRQQAPDFVMGIELKVPGKTDFAGTIIEAELFDYDMARFDKFKERKNNFVEWFDLDKLELPLEVRFRRQGDRFWPLGLKAEKRVGKFLTGEKTPQQMRRKAMIVADSEKIIWLCPIRPGESAKVTSQTQRILQLKVDS